MRLSGKVAIISGASSGIGAAIATAFGAEGASVVVNYLTNRQAADAVVSTIVTAGGKATAARADMSQPADIVRMFDTVKAEYGQIDVLVNNAAVAVFEMVSDLTEDAFHRQFNLNVLGYFVAIREATKHFGATGGSIINISSYLSTDPSPSASVYSATKAAVDTMTFALARELGPRGIRVNSILPGNTRTPTTRATFESPLGEKMLAGTPLGRFGEAEDIAPLAVFLASDDSRWVTGESIRAAGGVRGVGY